VDGYVISVLWGAQLTLAVSLVALAVAIALGLLGAAAKLSGRRPLVALAGAYITLARGVPELILLLLVYYGGTIGLITLLERLGWEAEVNIDPFMAGVLTIGFIYGAFMTETFRGAMLAIPKGQAGAAWSFGMSPARTFFRITLPQMVRYALPGFTNNWLVLIKATALVSLIGLHDVTFHAMQVGAATREPFYFLLLAAAVFLAYTSVSLWALRALSRRYALGSTKVSL